MDLNLSALAVLVTLPIWTGPVESAKKPLTCRVEMTYGKFGPKRSASAVVGEAIEFTIHLKGIEREIGNPADVTMEAWLRNSSGDTAVSSPPIGFPVVPHLGGDEIPVPMTLKLPRDLAAGKYFLVARAVDNRSKQEVTSEIEVQVDSEFAGIHEKNLRLTYDREGTVSILSTQSVGQEIHLRFDLVGYQTTDSEIAIEVRGDVLDRESDKRLTTLDVKPVKAKVSDDKPVKVSVTLDEIFANRPGKFDLLLQIIDKKNGDTREVRIPLSVYSAL